MRPSPSTMAAAASGESSSRSMIARDSQRTASWACSTSDGGSRFRRAACEERRSDVVDGRQPFVCAVAVCLAVELEGLVTAVERYCAVVLRVAEQLVPEREGSGCRQYVDHVNRDAEAGARGNGAREHGDRPANQMVLVAFGQLLAVSLGLAIATGELLVRPATCELLVGGTEIGHRSVREHDVNARALPRAGGRGFQLRDAAGAAPYLLGSHGRMAACRDRAPPARCAADGRGCAGRAAPCRRDRVSDARGGRAAVLGGGRRPSRPHRSRRAAAQPVPPAVSPPVSATDLRAARVVAARFLVSYLQVAYGRARATSVEAATPGLRSQLMRDRAQVTPAERARYPRVVSLQVLGTSPGFVVATASVEDGGIAAFRLRLTLQEQAGRWLVSDVQEG